MSAWRLGAPRSLPGFWLAMEATAADGTRALTLLTRERTALRRTAGRISLCADDAEDAVQRASLILLTRTPEHPEARLRAWMHLVTKREAIAVRRERERLLGGELPASLSSFSPCPAERAEARERTLERARALARLKPAERRAIVLCGQGYSYREICELTGWTYTKVNRCLAEGRARLRQLAGR